ncbi:MAG: EAL domain-containing protein [Pseudomonadota bacterium]
MDEADFLAETALFVPGFLYVLEERSEGRRMPYASPGLYDAFGVSAKSVREDADAAFLHIVPEDIAPLVESATQSQRTMTPWMFAFRVDHPERGLRWLMGRSTPRQLPCGGVRWFGMFQDITEERQAQEALTAAKAELVRQSDLLERFFTLSNDALGTIDKEGRITPMSDGWTAMLGWEASDLLENVGAKIFHEEDQATMRRIFRRVLRGEPVMNYVSRIRTKEGESRWVEWRAQPYDGSSVYFAVRDVSRREELQRSLQSAKDCAEQRAADLQAATARIEHNALHDALTGLPNRRYLERALEERRGGALAALHLDLDRFKEVNDNYGHAAGDAVLSVVAERIKGELGSDDFAARIGGDEFVVLPGATRTQSDLEDVSRRLIASVSQPICHDGRSFKVGLSIGAAIRESGAKDCALLLNADVALYRAKGAGGGRVGFFSPAMELQMRRRARVARQLAEALENDQILPFYQPQICAKSGAVTGVEALARWNHPIDGLLTPDQFLGVAEEIGLAADVDAAVLRRAHREMGAVRAELGAEIRLSVNVSARRLADPTLASQVAALRPEPGALGFEVVESVLIEDADPVILRNVADLRSAGVELEVDDFGSGHASIIALLKLRPGRLKIDRRLVQPLLESAEERLLVRSIIEIGKALDMDVVAEGVETAAHGALLSRLGCDVLQGFHYSRPVPIDALSTLIRERPWRASSTATAGAAVASGI